MSRTRERGRLWRLFRVNTKTFLNVILRHVRDDSGFSRPNVCSYVIPITPLLFLRDNGREELICSIYEDYHS